MPRSIQELRIERGLTQVELAELLEVSPLSVSEWENLVARPREKSLRKLAAVLQVPADELELAPVKKTGPRPGWRHTAEAKEKISQSMKALHERKAVASGAAA